MPTNAQKKIMQEWKLFKDLPETIFVRAYETRMDLLRAAIFGARGTPYHDGLFFFDIAFPADYPAKPPLLLLSIQALVLNERPYFNEPGNAGWAGRTYGEKKSLAYSEEVFVLSCKTMLCVLRRPPKNFEQLVTQHFKDSAEFILNACDAYRKGLAGVGLFNGVLKGTKAEVSVKFKGAVNQVYGELMVALSKTGASVGQWNGEKCCSEVEEDYVSGINIEEEESEIKDDSCLSCFRAA
uniref:UBC core domain-containing protein n=1 Tax=Chenopodium quinoa TaxID=63459 RepID=A0A803N2B4_CHEQI